jgi:hypothetical protein
MKFDEATTTTRIAELDKQMTKINQKISEYNNLLSSLGREKSIQEGILRGVQQLKEMKQKPVKLRNPKNRSNPATPNTGAEFSLTPKEILELSETTKRRIKKYLYPTQAEYTNSLETGFLSGEDGRKRSHQIDLCISQFCDWAQSSERNMKEANRGILNYIEFALLLPNALFVNALMSTLSPFAEWKLSDEAIEIHNLILKDPINGRPTWATAYTHHSACHRRLHEISKWRDAKKARPIGSEVKINGRYDFSVGE